ncbi:MAG: aromatic amino acid hydroxylase [Bdellovibrionales bacterium]
MQALAAHLEKFIVDQNQRPYTPRDHAVWRYILRQLKTFLGQHAHPFYLEGLQRTGITVESIPQIQEISERLQRFGWTAKAVSGFIPPAAFMEMQAASVLPIARDMRSIEHLLYTPAPDIVHEAAGHAPMIAHPEYSAYLQAYAQVARKAIISKEDLDVYEAIRNLSDVKENPSSTAEQIQKSEKNLQDAIARVSHVSEATLLSRMNWWTAEYGLIGTLEEPKIYGAGLLSSAGEARWCLSDKVKKLPLTLECVNYSYDITEPQPQLFVTPDFKHLSRVLDQLAEKMAYRTGGASGLDKAVKAQTVNTLELNSGLQISGQIVEFQSSSEKDVAFVRLSGPCQMSRQGCELPGHGHALHAQGYSTPLGPLKKYPGKCPSELSAQEWRALGIEKAKRSTVTLEYTSGFQIQGDFVSSLGEGEKIHLLTFENATATFQGRKVFEPSWGQYDVALGSQVVSVFGGPADRLKFGDIDKFVIAKVPAVSYKESDMKLFAYYQILRDIRGGKKTLFDLETIIPSMIEDFPNEWLLFLEGLEISLQAKQTGLEKTFRQQLERIQKSSPDHACIEEGLALAGQLRI